MHQGEASGATSTSVASYDNQHEDVDGDVLFVKREIFHDWINERTADGGECEQVESTHTAPS